MFNRIYLEITNHCNLTCSFCPPHLRNTKSLSIDELNRRILNIAQHTKNVYFHVKGEPLMSPHLKEALDASHRHHLRVHLVSNGLLIDQQGELILNHPAVETISISLHSYNELSPKLQDQHVDGLKRWLAGQLPHHPHVRLRIWDADTSDHMRSRHLIRRLTDAKLEEQNKPDYRVSLLPNLHIQSDIRFDWPDLSNGELYPDGRCKAGMMLAVLADGTITPCCLDGSGVIALGNIDHININDMLETQRYKDFLQGMNDRKPSEALCRSCSYKLRFD
jgi:radical SAM protein with 4Fe4S-binding SPASM domain